MGIDWQKKNVHIRPFDSFDYISQRENGFQETNAGVFNLQIEPSNAIMLRNELGMQLLWCSSFIGPFSKMMFSPKISWVREVRIKGDQYRACFTHSTQDSFFTVAGYFPSRSLFSPGVLVSGTCLKEFLTFALYYDGEFGQKYSDHTYGGQVVVRF
jgi:uncharacterized protein with beta-barrel porin domain